MKNATIILGPPGTGKTTELLNLIDGYLIKNTDPRKIGFVSFTRQSVNETKSRAATRFNKSERYFTYFRTIHSLAFMQLSMSKVGVMEKKHYQEVGNLLGVVIKGKSAQDCAVEDLERGDQLVFLESLSRMCCESYEDTYNKSNSDFSFMELELFAKTLTKYKKVNLLYDFTDMLTKYYNEGHKPPLDVLFVDEAQDLCPIQWRIIEQLSENSEKTYIAGDDDQAIFRWSGADIEYFINLSRRNDTKILEHSYRLPTVVHRLSTEIISQVGNRVDKRYSPTDLRGAVEYVTSLEDIDMSQGEWLLLVRNVYMISKVIDYLRLCGYAYASQYRSSKDIESLQAAILWEHLRNGQSIAVEKAKIVVSYMSSKKFKRPIRGLRSDELLNMKSLNDMCQLTCNTQIWHEALDTISFDDREYFIAARKQGESLTKEPRIRVSTIHGAKGGECENVVLHTDMSLKTYNQMMINYDDEVRVFYVGITRAKEKLFIVQPSQTCYFSI